MTSLQKRMSEDIQLAGLNPRAQKSYVPAVRELANFYKKSPDKITKKEIRDYFH